MKGCYAVTAPIRLMSHESSYLDWTLFCEPKPMTTYKLRDYGGGAKYVPKTPHRYAIAYQFITYQLLAEVPRRWLGYH